MPTPRTHPTLNALIDTHFHPRLIALQDGAGKTLALGQGALKGSNFGTLRPEGERSLDLDSAAFIVIDDSVPVPVSRAYFLGGGSIIWFLEGNSN